MPWSKEELLNVFRTTKGVRQGCVLSPLLFSLYIADMNKFFAAKGVGGVRLGNERVWSLADDMVLLAENRDALLDMMSTLKIFLRDRDLMLNVDKTKVLVFNKKRSEKKEDWKWEGKGIEEVQSFKYLGFVFNRNGSYKKHLKKIKNKGKVMANKVWDLGERIYKDDFGRR